MINKGSILVKLGRHVDAIEALGEAIRLAPENPLARVNIAAALRHVGELETAREQTETAIELNPTYPEAHGTLGDILAAIGDFDSALKAYDSALMLRPGFRVVRLNRAGALYKMGNLNDAASLYNSILTDFENSAEAYAGLGTIHLARGCLANAIKAYRKAVELDPQNGSAWGALAAAPGDILTRADIESLNQLCSNENVSQDQCIAAHFAIGDYFDKTEQYEDAFRHFQAGNERRKIMMEAKDLIFNYDSLIANVDEIINKCNKGFDKIKDANQDERLVFVIGMPRSGTSLVEQILAAHPEVVGLGEALTIAGLPEDMDESEMAERVLETVSEFLRVQPSLCGWPSPHDWGRAIRMGSLGGV